MKTTKELIESELSIEIVNELLKTCWKEAFIAGRNSTTDIGKDDCQFQITIIDEEIIKEPEIIEEESDTDLISICFSGETELFTGTRLEFANCFFSNANNNQIIKWCKTANINETYSLWINGKVIFGESTLFFEALTFWYNMSSEASFDIAIREHNYSSGWIGLSNEKLIETYNKYTIK